MGRLALEFREGIDFEWLWLQLEPRQVLIVAAVQVSGTSNWTPDGRPKGFSQRCRME